MGYRWTVQTDGTFNDGINIWDFVRLKAENYDLGTQLILGRPRLGKRMRIAMVISDVTRYKKWSMRLPEGRSVLSEVIEFDTERYPFQVGDELELLEEASPVHILS
jgi:hypothetical protein